MIPDPLKRVAARLRPVAINLGLVTASLLVALLVAEGAVRLVAPQQLIQIRPDLWEPADTVGWLHRPDVDVSMNTGERTVRVRTDRDGFRVGSRGRVEAERRILVLGDSFMEALQVEYEGSFPGLLEERIPDELSEPIAVRNAGIGGWDPDQYLLRAQSLLDDDEYDLVLIALYLGNDVIPRRRTYVPPRTPVQRFHFRFPRSLSRGELTEAILRPINDGLEVRSHLFVFVKNRLETVRMEVGLAATTFPTEFLESEATKDRWTVTADLCADIDALARAHGARSLFVLVPTSFQVDSADFRSYVQGYDLDPSTIDLDQPNRLLGTALADRGLRVLDPLDAFREAHDAGRQLYGSVDLHFSPQGHELLADLVAPVVSELMTTPPVGEARGGGS